MDRKPLRTELALELRPDFRRTRHGVDAEEAGVGGEVFKHLFEIFAVVGGEFDAAADFEAFPLGVEEKRAE